MAASEKATMRAKQKAMAKAKAKAKPKPKPKSPRRSKEEPTFANRKRVKQDLPKAASSTEGVVDGAGDDCPRPASKRGKRTSISAGPIGEPAPSAEVTPEASGISLQKADGQTPDIASGCGGSSSSTARAPSSREFRVADGPRAVPCAVDATPVAATAEMASLMPQALARGLQFGAGAFGPLGRSAPPPAAKHSPKVHRRIPHLVRESVHCAAEMRGERGCKLVTTMLADCYVQGLFMHGPPTSPVNREIIPATRFIFEEMQKLPVDNLKRVSCLSALASACQDCQQVQAREIMRIYGDLTAQAETLERQLKYSLVRMKESSLDRYISERHPCCDLDHTFVDPWEQRPHLVSGYVSMVGEELGFDGVVAASSDRFLPMAVRSIGRVSRKELRAQIVNGLSVHEWLQALLADINNQVEGADRLINRDCIFQWARENMSAEAAHLVFYDAERAAEFKGQDPDGPSAANRYQPFLSARVLVNILCAADMLCVKRED